RSGFTQQLAPIQEPQPNQNHTLIIEEFEPDVFRQVIEYIHTGCVMLQPRTLLGVMNAADYYGLNQLRSACAGFVQCCITVDTVCALLASAERYIQYKCTKSLVQKVLEFVDEHGNEVLNLGSFTLLPQHVVRLILAREELRADEFTKFQAALMWSKKYCDSNQNTSLKEVIGNFLEYIQFHKIPTNVLMKEVHPLDLVPSEIIMNALAYQADPSSVDPGKLSPHRVRRQGRCMSVQSSLDPYGSNTTLSSSGSDAGSDQKQHSGKNSTAEQESAGEPHQPQQQSGEQKLEAEEDLQLQIEQRIELQRQRQEQELLRQQLKKLAEEAKRREKEEEEEEEAKSGQMEMQGPEERLGGEESKEEEVLEETKKQKQERKKKSKKLKKAQKEERKKEAKRKKQEEKELKKQQQGKEAVKKEEDEWLEKQPHEKESMKSGQKEEESKKEVKELMTKQNDRESESRKNLEESGKQHKDHRQDPSLNTQEEEHHHLEEQSTSRNQKEAHREEKELLNQQEKEEQQRIRKERRLQLQLQELKLHLAVQQEVVLQRQEEALLKQIQERRREEELEAQDFQQMQLYLEGRKPEPEEPLQEREVVDRKQVKKTEETVTIRVEEPETPKQEQHDQQQEQEIPAPREGVSGFYIKLVVKQEGRANLVLLFKTHMF
ncbi:PREDICTED: trichohyalin-like, partial [Dufourea novaeangliae]